MSKIEWTGETWNPSIGCDMVSKGCENCYAIKEAWVHSFHPNEKIATKFKGTVKKTEQGKFQWTGELIFDEHSLSKPLRTKKPTTFFVNSMSDLFHPMMFKNRHFLLLERIFAVMALTPQHTYQVLTKRPEAMFNFFNDNRIWNGLWKEVNLLHDQYINKLEQELHFYDEVKSWFPLTNVWFGVSCEDQKAADERIPWLLKTPAAVRFLSCEPLLGLVDLHDHFSPTPTYITNDGENILEDWEYKSEIDWVIAGGESGPNARPMHPDWVRSLRYQCRTADVSFFFKQWGEWMPSNHSNRADGTYCIINNKGDKLTAQQIMLENHDQCLMVKNGKKKNGRLLDGIEWNEIPKNTITA